LIKSIEQLYNAGTIHLKYALNTSNLEGRIKTVDFA
jgi:hypothetical protein